MKKYKILLSVFMVIVIISLSVAPILAEDKKVVESETIINKDVLTEDYVVTDEDNEGPLNNDKKILCNATIDDEFDDSSVLVVMKNEASLDFDDFDCTDFSEIEYKNTREITGNRSQRIFNEYEAKKTECVNTLKKMTSSNSTTTRSDIATLADNSMTAVNNKVIEQNAELITKAEMKNEYSAFHKIICVELNTSDKQSVLDAIKELEKNEDILAVTPNYTSRNKTATANDTRITEQWALENASIKSAWDIHKGSSSVKVGIIDDGIDADHPDLAGNYDSGLSKSFTDAPADESISGHGTQVAGVIGAVGNNYRGIAGVCWNVSLVSLQVDYANGEWELSNTIDAIEYADEKGIQIINNSNSISINGEPAPLEAAINNYDGIFITSAGNSYANIDTTSPINTYVFPSKLTSNKIISVASINSNNNLAYDSNYGVTSVDLAAPGESILTTNGGDYGYVRGTSFAAPYVAGVAALIKSKYPSITNYGIRKAILDSVTKCSTLTNKVKTGGKLNAYGALCAVGQCEYTVTYNSNGGTGSMSNSTITYGFFEELNNLNYTKPLHNFIGWDACRASDNKHRYKSDSEEKWFVEGTQPSGYSKALYKNRAPIAHTTTVDGDVVTMTAQWTPYTYTIIFDGNGAYGSMYLKSYNYNEIATLPELNYYYGGYAFDGWKVYKGETESNRLWLYKNGTTYNWYAENSQPSGYSIVKFEDEATVSNLSYVDKEKIYFVAQWQPLSYTINYEANGGTGVMQDSVGYSDQETQLSSNTFTKEHHKFIGWYVVDSDGYWSVTSNAEWLDGNPSENILKLYEDGGTLVYTVDYAGAEINAIAQWILLGDVDLDGEISIIDATLMQKYFARVTTFTEEQLMRGDFNEDGSFDISDVTAVQAYIASLG